MKERLERNAVSNSKLFMPVTTPLAAAIFAALSPAGVAVAQDTAAEDEAIEEIVTTGSRIRRDTFSSAAPMDVILGSSASARGINDVATLLQSTSAAQGGPQVTAAASSVGFLNEGIDPANGGVGTSTLSLRGLGANRTLVLLNGRRTGPSGVQGAVSSFDLGAVPLSAVDRVEVLKDGASSIYGSDAVAGVVNIITRKDEGATFEAFISQPNDSGGEQRRISGSYGKDVGNGYFRATVDYNKTEIMKREDRDFFNCEEDYTFDTATGARADLIDPRTGNFLCNDLPWGHVWVYDYAAYVGGDGDGTTNVGPPSYLLQYDFDGLLAANGLQPLAPATNPNYMTAPDGWYPIRQGDALSDSLYDAQHPLHGRQTLIPDNEVITLMLEGEYDVSDSLSLYSEVLVNRRETAAIGYKQFWSYIYNYDSADWGGFGGGGAPSDPASVGWTGAQWLSPLSITDHASQSVTVDYQRFVVGARGEMETSFLAGWDWDMSFQYSNSDGEYVTDVILKDALEHTFFISESCVGTNSPITGRPCVDIPWLDPNFLAGDVPQAVEDYLFATDIGSTQYKQWSVEGYMSGELFDMPAGSAAMAFGFHYRDDDLLDTPGIEAQRNNSWQGDSANITKGDTQTTAVFVEFDLPLLSGKTMAEYVDFNVSARYTEVDVGLAGSAYNDTTYKAGFNWAFTDSFRARTTLGTSFRSPALYELFLANQSSSLTARAADPCILWGNGLANGTVSQRVADNCAADGIPDDHIATVGPSVLTGGGAGVLSAETSEAFTFGVVWQPEFADLSVSVDYFDILVEDEIDKIGGARIVAGCYNSAFFATEPLCNQFDRSGPAASLPNAITEIRDSFINVAKQQVRGLDVAAKLTQDVGRAGSLIVDTQWTLNYEDTEALFDETEEDLSGTAGHPDTVGTVSLTLLRDEWSFNWGMNYIGETDNSARFGRETVTNSTGDQVRVDLSADSVLYHSLSASYDFDNGVTARVGMANVTDEKPPRLTALGTANEVTVLGQSAFYSQYDWLGRRAFVNVTMSFD